MPPRGSALYAEYIAEQVKREDERKASLETRGIAVVTTSGALATLLLGFATFTKSPRGQFVLPDASHEWVKRALILFTAAAVGAIVTNFPFRYRAAGLKGLRALRDKSWNDSIDTAEDAIAANRLNVLASAKLWNGGTRARSRPRDSRLSSRLFAQSCTTTACS